MSTIIQALRKAEQEDKKEKIAQAVLPLAPKKKKNSFLLWAFFGLTSACVITFFLVTLELWMPEKKEPPLSPPNALTFLTLSGILWDSEEPYALINQKTLKKGDKIEGGRILDISKDSVQISFNDEVETLHLEN